MLIATFCVLAIFFASLPLNAQPLKWQVSAIIPEDSIREGQLYFSDSLHGYFLGYKKLSQGEYFYYSYKKSVLYRTTDGGSSWTKIDFHSVYGADTIMYNSISSDIYDVSFAVIRGSSSCVMANISGGGGDYFHDTLKFYWSNDYGVSWSAYKTQPITKRGDFKLETIPNAREVIALRVRDENNKGNIGKFIYSQTYGVDLTNNLRWDSTLLKNLSSGSFNAGQAYSVNNHNFDYFDDTTWIVTVPDSNNAPPGKPDSAKPYRLVTLLSTDAGLSWEAYRNIIPHFPSNNTATYFYSIKCIRGTPYVYMFTDAFSNDLWVPTYGVNYVYSSDYGKSWSSNSSFSSNRKAYTAISPGEIWCTTTPHDSVTDVNPANWIVHSIDNGKTWDIDSTSLFNDGYYDGRIVTFSDERHGWIFAQRLDRHQVAIFKYNLGKNAVKPDISFFKSNEINYTLYPNPASAETTIQLTNNVKLVSIDFFDILGRKLVCPYEKSGESAHIRTDTLRSGCYIAHVTQQYGNYMIPFVVQH